MLLRWLGAAAAAAIAAGVAAPPAALERREAFDAAVPWRPAPIRTAGGNQLLVYELHLTNFTAEPLQVRSLAVVDAGSSRTLALLSGSSLSRVIPSPSRPVADTIGPGDRAILYVELDCGRGPVPAAIEHRIEYASGDRVATIRAAARLKPRNERAPALGPPLRGGPWVAVHSPDWARGHRRVFYAVDGAARLPGRFAIDWVRVDERGRIAGPDPDRASSALGYGADVLAVADAPVVAVRDGMAESATVSANPAHGLDGAAGNFIILGLGERRYAVYEHLRPGSIKVRPGDKVRRGEVIAALGFSGDTTGPHLHFHVADRPDPVAAEGVPFEFERFTVLGRYPDLAALGARRWQPVPPASAMRTGEWPESNSVIRFDR